MNFSSPRNPARLDRRITLLSPEATRDASGGEVKSWVEVGEVWGDWTPTTGREIQQAGQKISLAAGSMVIRWRQGVSATWRVMMAETVYELIAPPTEIGRRQYLDLTLRALSGEAPDALSVRLLHDYSYRRLHDDSLALMHDAA